MLINAKISVFLFLSNRQPRSRNFLLCPICKKTHWSLPVHLRRSCMRTSSEADILAVVESAKRAVSNLLRTGRVWEYSLLSRIMQSPDTIGRMIEELESRGNAVVGIPTEAPTAAVPAVPDVPVEAPAESSSESSGELYQCPDTTKQGTSLRERMASLGYYKKHSLDHDLLVSFAKFLQFDMSNENFKQEVENVARFLYFMDPQQASLLFVRQHEKSREYFLKLSEAGLSKQTVQNYIKSVKRFLKFHTGSTDLCFTDRVLHEDCKNYISFLDNIQMATSKQVSKETTRKRFDTFQEGVLSSTQVTAVLAAAKKDFLAVIGKLHAGECSPGHQLTLTELQLVLYYLEAIVILEHAQRPGVVEHMTRSRNGSAEGEMTLVLVSLWFPLRWPPLFLPRNRRCGSISTSRRCAQSCWEKRGSALRMTMRLMRGSSFPPLAKPSTTPPMTWSGCTRNIRCRR
uniref:Core-binding (CB) domain-containing protein n=1 Tax=Pygocentrus nattereri TaxID=42514 RepID=A0A3B4CJB6_PYGNA